MKRRRAGQHGGLAAPAGLFDQAADLCLAAFEKGWTPATLIWDVPRLPALRRPERPARAVPPGQLRRALPRAGHGALGAGQLVQHPGGQGAAVRRHLRRRGADPGALSRRLGIDTSPRRYGLSLTLGGGEVTLLDMTSAFGTFANNGKRMPPVAITRITDFAATWSTNTSPRRAAGGAPRARLPDQLDPFG
jgi:hypothetical protein